MKMLQKMRKIVYHSDNKHKYLLNNESGELPRLKWKNTMLNAVKILKHVIDLQSLPFHYLLIIPLLMLTELDL